MKSVGIRVLKNQLSKYLSMVRAGETVLVTDRDEVVTEIKQPSPWNLPGVDSDWAFLQRLAAEGRLIPARERLRPKMPLPPPPPFKVEMMRLLDEVRGGR
jgi:antitoxin (DNA-binding transcriptional repressor) of toxin-antitoxin stability system